MTSTIEPSAADSVVPRVGMLATVRTRRALVSSVDPFDGGPDGTLHLVSVDYTEPDGPATDTLIWEREPGATVLEPTALPRVADTLPMAPREFDALVRATRWSALSPYIDPDGDGPLPRLPVAAPLHGAIQMEDYQMVPLQMALRMPRISLLLADDVGLGKTIEAGLILTELLLRRRIRRVFILCPASLRRQWRSEMLDRFALPFDIVDRPGTEALHRRAGLDANPWRSHPRAITSYHYLRQPDVLESFRQYLDNEAARHLVRAAMAEGARRPSIGYELHDDDAAGWPIEAAWPAERVALVLDDMPARDEWLNSHGWVSRRVERWSPADLAAAINGGAPG